jgi:hypothetical protein
MNINKIREEFLSFWVLLHNSLKKNLNFDSYSKAYNVTQTYIYMIASIFKFISLKI